MGWKVNNIIQVKDVIESIPVFNTIIERIKVLLYCLQYDQCAFVTCLQFLVKINVYVNVADFHTSKD